MNSVSLAGIEEVSDSQIPDGAYRFVVDGSDIEKGNYGTQFKLVGIIMEGPFQGNRLTHWFTLERNEKNWGLRMFKTFLKAVAKENKSPEEFKFEWCPKLIGLTFSARIENELNSAGKAYPKYKMFDAFENLEKLQLVSDLHKESKKLKAKEPNGFATPIDSALPLDSDGVAF
jgi:hypothetical protein